MTTIGPIGLAGLVQLSAIPALELKVSREALQRSLQQQLFNGPEGRPEELAAERMLRLRRKPRSSIRPGPDRGPHEEARS